MDPWKNIADLPKSDIENLQNRKLKEFINEYLYPFSPHYKKLFDEHNINPKNIRSINDLKNIPLTSKHDFIDSGDAKNKAREFILQPDAQKIRDAWSKPKLLRLAVSKILKGADYVQEGLFKEFRPIFITFTTGTTNTPCSFLYTDYDIRNLYSSGARMLRLFDIDGSERIVNMFPYAPHLAFWQVVFGGLSSGVLILSTGGGKVMGTEGNISALSKMQPVVILGVPSYVYHVIRMAKEKGCQIPSIKKVVLGAARVTEAFKARLRNELDGLGAKDVSVFGTYGFTESRCAWAECPTEPGISSGYHLYPDKEIFEVIDPDSGEVKSEGEDGELVYTSIDSRGSSVIRYRTGDFVKGGVTYEPCPHCRRTVGRISSDITRISDIKDFNLSKVKGQLVNLNHFMTCLSEFDAIKEWQIEICKKDNDPHEVDQVIVYAAVEEGTNKSDLEKEITDSILLATEVRPNQIKFVTFKQIVERLELETASKEKRIIDKRPKG